MIWYSKQIHHVLSFTYRPNLFFNLMPTHIHLELVIVLRHDIRNILHLHLDHQGQFLVSRQPRASAAFEYIPNSIERTTMLRKSVDMLRFL